MLLFEKEQTQVCDSRLSFSLLFFLASTQALTAGVLYSVTNLGTLGGGQSYGYGINNAGQAVGVSDTGQGSEHAFLYTNGQMQDLGTLGGAIGVAYGVNDAGQVTGASRTATSEGVLHGFLYTNNQMQDIGTTGDVSGQGINDRGQITGGYYPSTSPATLNAFVYANGQIQNLGTLGGVGSIGFGINNAGQIAGDADTAGGATHAFLYANGKLQDLGTLPGGQASIAYALNNSGEVTGISYDSFGPGVAQNVNHAFLYANGQMQDLGTLGGYISIGKGINDAGQIVGASSYMTGNDTVDAFLYENGQMQDLNNLIDPTLHLTLTGATGINDSGEIVAEGYDNQAYLLTPVPEPGTCLLLLTGALLMYLPNKARHRAAALTATRELT